MLAQDLLAPLDGSGLPPEVRALEDAEGELRVGLPALTEAVVVEEAGAAEALRTGHAHLGTTTGRLAAEKVDGGGKRVEL